MNNRIFILMALVCSVGGYVYYFQNQSAQHPHKTLLDDVIQANQMSNSKPTSAQTTATEPPQDAMLIGKPIEFSHVWRDTVVEQNEALDLVTSKNFIEELKNITAWDTQDVLIWEGTFEGQIQFDQPEQNSPNIEVVLDKLSNGQRHFQWSVIGTTGQEGKSTETLWQDDSAIPFPSMAKYVERNETSYIFDVNYNGQTAYAHMFSPSTDPDFFVGIIYVSNAPDIIQRIGTVWLRRAN